MYSRLAQLAWARAAGLDCLLLNENTRLPVQMPIISYAASTLYSKTHVLSIRLPTWLLSCYENNVFWFEQQ